MAGAFKAHGSKVDERLREGDQVIVAGPTVTDTCIGNGASQNRCRQAVLVDACGTSL